jgi:hypothetical protein
MCALPRARADRAAPRSRVLRACNHGAFLLAAFAATAAPRAQCDAVWQGPPAPGPLGTIQALLQLPNGEWIAGGSFRIADGGVVNNIARWDGVSWHPLGNGTNSAVTCLARLPNGDLVAGGSFSTAGGQPCASVARWNGQTWAPIGSGPGGEVNALRVAANGNLIAGGSFNQLAYPPPNVLQWDGVTWSALGAPLGNPLGTTQALAWLANGDLVAGGNYLSAPGLQRWNGTSWQAIPGLNGTVFDVATLPNGDLAILGNIQINGVPAVLAIWNGTTMQAVPASPITFTLGALAAAANGDVILGGSGNTNLARWNGTSWSPIAGGFGSISQLREDAAGNLVAGFTDSLGPFPPPASVRRFDGTTWQNLGAAIPPYVQAMTRLPNGDVVIGGLFASIEGTSAASIARWNGTSWSPLGLGVGGLVQALATAPNGDLIVGGHLLTAGGAPVVNIARWDGQTWSTLGAGFALPTIVQIKAIAIAGTGEVMVMTSNGVLFRFDGLQWQQVTSPILILSGNAMVTLANGDVLIGGSFVTPAPSSQVGLVRFSGGTLTPVPGAPSFVNGLLVTDDGAVVVQSANLSRWDGSSWTPLPSVSTTFAQMAQLPNGELVACGHQLAFGGAPLSCLFRLRSGVWESWGEITGARQWRSRPRHAAKCSSAARS